ncbi:glycogen synthase [Kineobactrum sediminis]|uniref:starch synthase n=2 Tax=Kineobactrum sediminis TaxID=1905677 RepID=A0A2N5Y7T2_9GAMM|nr:glycogen synthase [Kineobactrum sediminis]
MVAAENGALPGGKVGGMGDVIRDVPSALVPLGHDLTVLTPGYQHFSRYQDAVQTAIIEVPFRGGIESVTLWALPPDPRHPGVNYRVLEHPLLAPCGPGKIYCDDPPGQPFAMDSSKFALFCAAVAQALVQDKLPCPDVLHLHDWHTAMVALLIHFDPALASLQSVHRVYTIHNLALQGIRPVAGDDSALTSWFPYLGWDHELIGDPRYPDCFNPMRAGINLCHKVHTVSPTYAAEIQTDSQGEGLSGDLRRAAAESRLEGILNGCEYPGDSAATDFETLLAAARRELYKWQAAGTAVTADRTLAQIAHYLESGRRPSLLVTSVGRLTDQKVSLLKTPMADGLSCMEHLLQRLGEDGLLIMLGSGDHQYERFFAELAGTATNFIFLCGFSESFAESLYVTGDLFLMPSSFEPCGISQMLAMRGAQPCLVHAVGGLADTVQDGVNGFSFGGADAPEQAARFLQRFSEVLTLRTQHPEHWRDVCERAAAARFQWADIARAYDDRLYRSGLANKR